jgi:organic hydroperoxide reductase OsmC/OhrA
VKNVHFTASATQIGDRLLRMDATGKPEVEVVTPPEFKGARPDAWSPEELLLGAVATCFELTFQAFAEREGVPIHSLDARADGKVEYERGAGMRFTSIVLDVDLVTDPGREGEAEALAHQAEQRCIIGRSLNAAIDLRVTARSGMDEAA